MRRVRPVVVAEETENLEQFPIDDLRVVHRRSLPARAVDKASHMIAGRRFLREARYCEILREEGAEVIHGQFGWSTPLALPLARTLGLPLIATFYGADMSLLPRDPAWRRVYHELFAQADAILVEGSHMRRGLVALGCPAEKVVIQRIGIEVNEIECVPRTPPADRVVVFLVCGSFIQKKGIPVAIDAFAKARSKHRGMRLDVVGDGPMRGAIEDLIDHLGVHDCVRLLGYRTHSEYLALSRDAHVFVAASQTADDGETEGGAPTVLLEMQAAGVPVVSTLHADIPGIVMDGRAGFLVPERDSDALAERMVFLAKNPEAWPAMGAEGRRYVETHHDIEAQTRTIEDIYLRLIGQQSKGHATATASSVEATRATHGGRGRQRIGAISARVGRASE